MPDVLTPDEAAARARHRDAQRRWAMRHPHARAKDPLNPRIVNRPVAARFWEKVDQGSPGCWLWQGSLNWKGYGTMTVARRTLRAHRVAWEMTNGPVPLGLLVLHRCDNRACVRPDHLFLGTAHDNTRDMIAKGRGPIMPGSR